MNAAPEIVTYHDSLHRHTTVALWQNVFGCEGAHNEPNLVIERKLAVDDGLFWVAAAGDAVVGSIMAGYDGHRGWLYSLAVLPDYRGGGLGSHLVKTAEKALSDRGCVKINLQIIESNAAVKAFYESLGYTVEPRVSMGKRLHG